MWQVSVWAKCEKRRIGPFFWLGPSDQRGSCSLCSSPLCVLPLMWWKQQWLWAWPLNSVWTNERETQNGIEFKCGAQIILGTVKYMFSAKLNTCITYMNTEWDHLFLGRHIRAWCILGLYVTVLLQRENSWVKIRSADFRSPHQHKYILLDEQ